MTHLWIHAAYHEFDSVLEIDSIRDLDSVIVLRWAQLCRSKREVKKINESVTKEKLEKSYVVWFVCVSRAVSLPWIFLILIHGRTMREL